MTFFTLSTIFYAALVAWVSSRVAGTTAEWGYTLAHMTLAAAINAHLLWVARRRELSFLGSAPLAFLVVYHVYFTLSGLKYFSPIILYPQFDLTLGQQFVGSVAAAAGLFGCAVLLRRERAPTSERLREWVAAHWGDVRRLMMIAVAGSLCCKFLLFRLGYGSIYSGSAYSENAVRSYGDFFILLANDIFGLLAVTFGMICLLYRGPGRRSLGMYTLAAFGFLLQIAYVLLYLKARMILLTTPIALALTAEIVSRRRAERWLQGVFLVLPMLSLLGVQLTLLIGRFNVPEDTGLRLAIGAVNRRGDLSDFSTAMMVASNGQAHDVRIVSSSVLNAIPRAVFPGKENFVPDVYSEILEQRLGWPAGAGEDLQADYLDTAFSNGVMAFGVAGFFIVPLALVWLWGSISRWLDRRATGLAYGLTLIAVTLAAMHIEGEWAWIPLNIRQGVFYALIFLGLAIFGRIVHQMLVVATIPRALLPDTAGDAQAPSR